MQQAVETFTGFFDGVSAAEFLKPGGIAGGKNIRKISPAGGWKPRGGYALLNTTGLAAKISSIHHYRNIYNGDYHLITQAAGVLRDSTANLEDLVTTAGGSLVTTSGAPLMAISNAVPFEQATTIGSTLYSPVGTVNPGFSCVVGEDWIYCDGSGLPLIYGGVAPRCEAFLVYASANNYVEYSAAVKDIQTATYAIIPAGTSKYYVASKQRASAIALTFGVTKNTNVVTAVVKAWRSGAWTTVSGASDGTAGTATHDSDGTISWTGSALDEMTVLANKQAFWYEVSFSGAVTETHIATCRVVRAIASMTNKWDGAYRVPATAAFYDASETSYNDRTGAISSVSEDEYMSLDGATTSDYLYVKMIEPVCILGLLVPDGYQNSLAAAIDLVETWTGSAWTSVAFTDTTKGPGGSASFAQTGKLILNNHTPAKLSLGETGDPIAGYWYRISWAASLSASTRIYLILYGAQPEALPRFTGCAAFQGRLVLWGHPDYPNRLVRSDYSKPDELCTLSERLSQPFGDLSEIVCCIALPEILLVLKKNGTFYTSDLVAALTINGSVGIAGPKTLTVAAVGDYTMSRDQVTTVAIWGAADGFYKFDKTAFRKISSPIDNYFTPGNSETLTANEVQQLQAIINPVTNEYHVALPDRELVYNAITDEWYPRWERALTLSTLSAVQDESDSWRVLGGTTDGFLLLLEEGVTSDRSSADAEVAIEHSVLSRFILGEAGSIQLILRRLWAMLKAQASGTIVTKTYSNFDQAGTVQATPEVLSLVKAGYTRTVPGVDLAEQAVLGFQVEFLCNTLNVEMWIYWFSYQFEPHSLYLE